MTKQAEQAALTTDAPLVRRSTDAAEPPSAQAEPVGPAEAPATGPTAAPSAAATPVPPRESVATAAAAATQALGTLNAKR